MPRPTTELSVTIADREFTVYAVAGDDGTWTEGIFEGPHGWDGSDIRYGTAADCLGSAVADIVRTIDDGN